MALTYRDICIIFAYGQGKRQGCSSAVGDIVIQSCCFFIVYVIVLALCSKIIFRFKSWSAMEM